MNFSKNFARNYGKEIILGASDAWSMSNLEYYIEDCRISSCEQDQVNNFSHFIAPL